MTSGCTEECADRFDCTSKGEGYVCSDGKCVKGQPPAADAGHDAGTQPEDAGTTEDAGTQDAGTSDAGTTDGGTGPECTSSNPTCAGPFQCDLSGADGGAGTCRPLWIGVTQSLDAGVGVRTGQATLVQFDNAGMRTNLGTAGASTRLPRFSGDGQSVVYVEQPAVGVLGPISLRVHPLTGGAQDTVLVTATDAGTDDFVQLEYAPSQSVLWTKVEAATSTKSGIQWVPGAGGAVKMLATGGYGDWFPGGTSFAFSNVGVNVFDTGDGGTRALTQSASDILPQVSRDGALVLFLKAGMTDFSDDLYVVPASGGTPVAVAMHAAPVGSTTDGGTLGTYPSHPTWGNPGQVAYVRVSYYGLDDGGTQLCDTSDPACSGTAGQEIVFQQVDPATGAVMGAPVAAAVGVLPSVSPDGTWLAYVIRGQTGGSELRVVPIDATGAVTDGGFTHTFPQLDTTQEEGRPRWQPK